MKREEFEAAKTALHDVLERIRESAHSLHESVGQHYDGDKPYSFHLDMVAQGVSDYGYVVCQDREDILPIFFGAWYHDSIEDARLTYNAVKRTARSFMNGKQALMATEIVYALTNEKGRTRAERANERYYQGIRLTPYAPFVKLCDRMANISYSYSNTDRVNIHMRRVYAQELPHFLEAIRTETDDPRMGLPEEMIQQINYIIK